MFNGFIGEYESTLDSKGRFLLPQAFKKQLPEDSGNLFIVCRGFEKCIILYPKQNWEPTVQRLATLSDYEQKHRDFRRVLLNGAVEVEMDGAGRLNLPNNLIAFAGLEKDIVLASALNKIEIWDSKAYQKFFEDYSPATFSKLAEEVMGKNAGSIS